MGPHSPIQVVNANANAILRVMSIRWSALLRLIGALLLAAAVLGPLVSAAQASGMPAGSVAMSEGMDAHSCDSCGEEMALEVGCATSVCHAAPILTTEGLWLGAPSATVLGLATDLDLRGLAARPDLQPPRTSILV